MRHLEGVSDLSLNGTIFYNASLIETPPPRDDVTMIAIDAHPLALELKRNSLEPRS